MFEILIYFLTAWLAIGTFVCLASNSRRHIDRVIRNTLIKKGRLPNSWDMFMASVLLAVLWPVPAYVFLNETFEVRRRGRA